MAVCQSIDLNFPADLLLALPWIIVWSGVTLSRCLKASKRCHLRMIIQACDPSTWGIRSSSPALATEFHVTGGYMRPCHKTKRCSLNSSYILDRFISHKIYQCTVVFNTPEWSWKAVSQWQVLRIILGLLFGPSWDSSMLPIKKKKQTWALKVEKKAHWRENIVSTTIYKPLGKQVNSAESQNTHLRKWEHLT